MDADVTKETGQLTVVVVGEIQLDQRINGNIRQVIVELGTVTGRSDCWQHQKAQERELHGIQIFSNLSNFLKFFKFSQIFEILFKFWLQIA